MTDRRTQLLEFYDEFPFECHPLWRAVIARELSYEQVIRGEVQHWIRTRAGQTLRAEAVEKAEASSAPIFDLLLETFLEECTDKRGPNHLGLIERLVLEGGYTHSDLERALPTPGNSAAIALYRDIGLRGPGCHMLGAGAVEYFYSQLSPTIFEAYTNKYGMTHHQAETYRLHGPMDRVHAERAFAIIDEAARLHGWETVRMSVRDAFVATSLHYDGMLHGATGTCSYWNGRRT